jgi:hypothetical protein
MPLEAADIEGDALEHHELAGIDVRAPRANIAFEVALGTLGIHLQVTPGSTPRCRPARSGVGYDLELPYRMDPRLMHEDVGHEFSEARVPALAAQHRRHRLGYERCEEDSIHLSDALAMPAEAYRVAWARARRRFDWLADVFGVPELAAVRRYGELIGPMVLVRRGAMECWGCDGLDWLTGRLVLEVVMGQPEPWATVVPIRSERRAWAVLVSSFGDDPGPTNDELCRDPDYEE